MNQETVNLQIPFESLVDAIASLGLEEKRKFSSLIKIKESHPYSIFPYPAQQKSAPLAEDAFYEARFLRISH
jgi:hypothetical protein